MIRFAVYRCARRLGWGRLAALGIATAPDPLAALAAARFVKTGTIAGHAGRP